MSPGPTVMSRDTSGNLSFHVINRYDPTGTSDIVRKRTLRVYNGVIRRRCNKDQPVHRLVDRAINPNYAWMIKRDRLGCPLWIKSQVKPIIFRKRKYIMHDRVVIREIQSLSNRSHDKTGIEICIPLTYFSNRNAHSIGWSWQRTLSIQGIEKHDNRAHIGQTNASNSALNA